MVFTLQESYRQFGKVRRVLKYLCFRADGFYLGYSQIRLLERFAVQTLTQRSKIAKLLFVQKLPKSTLDCPSFLAQVNFHINLKILQFEAKIIII